MPCFRARKSSHSKHRAGAGCFPTFFSFKLDQPAQEREEDAALASPLCRWLPGLSLSPSCPDAVLLSLSPDRWFWPSWGLNWSPPSSSRPLCLCSLCCWTGMSHHGWGTQRLCCWADFPSGSPGSGWSLHTGAPMPAEQRGVRAEHRRTLKRKGSDDLLGQQVLNCSVRLSPPLLTSLLPCRGDFYSRRGYPEPGGAIREP